jgi:HSF-type DNA-binding
MLYAPLAVYVFAAKMSGTTVPGRGTVSAPMDGKRSEATSKNPQEVVQSYKPEASANTGAGALRLPDKMMAILVSGEAPDAIWWLQNGTAFAMQKEKFQEQILDKHFRGNKFKSLVRNLHRW